MTNKHGISPLSPAQLAVAKLACDFTVRHLQAHRTDPGRIQTASLFGLQKVMVEMAFGYIPTRTFVSLPAGFGKTSAVAGLVVALHALREALPATVSVLVAAEKVEALCTLKRDIVELATREGHLEGLVERLGLEHSYGSKASEPPTESNETRPFLLATHARLAGSRGTLEKLNVFREGLATRSRDLVVWDEKLEVGSVAAFDYRILSSSLAATIEGLTFEDPALHEACVWAQEAKETINQAAKQDAAEGAVACLPPMDEAKRLRVSEALKGTVGESVVRSLLPMAGGLVRVNPRKNASGCSGGVVKFIATIPDELKRLVVLDASAEVSRLYAADQRIVNWTALPGMKGLASEVDFTRLKDYSPVEIRFMQRGGGYSTVQADAKSDATLVRDVVEVLKGLPEGEAALLFTYKPRDRDDIDLTETFKAAMKKAGIDPDETVPFERQRPDGSVVVERRPRFPIATWGQETSSNEWVHCKHVLLPGVLRMPFGVTFGQYLAARDDLAAAYPKAVEEDVVRGQLAGAIYQAASRGSCRSTTADGKARPMTLYLVDKDAGLRAEVSKLMPGARWVEWEGEYRKPKSSARPKIESEADRAFVRVLQYLEGRSKHVTSMSTKALWQKVDPSHTVSRDVRLRVIERFNVVTEGWVRVERSLVRAEALPALEAEEIDCAFADAVEAPTASPWDF